MEIDISSRHARLSPALVELTRTKIERLERLDGNVRRAEVHFVEERNPRIADRDTCEVRLDGPGRRLYSKVAAPDPVSAVDAAVAKLENQLARQKTRRRIRLQGH